MSKTRASSVTSKIESMVSCYILLEASIALLSSESHHHLCILAPFSGAQTIWFLHVLLITVKKNFLKSSKSKHKMMITSLVLEKRKQWFVLQHQAYPAMLIA